MTKLSFKEKEKTQIKLQRINKQLNDIVENIESMHILINPEDPLAPPMLNPEWRRSARCPQNRTGSWRGRRAVPGGRWR